MIDYIVCGCCGGELDGNGDCPNYCVDEDCDCRGGQPMADAKTKLITPVAALRQFFGLKSGQNNVQFLAELKALSPENRKELAELAAKELEATLIEP